MGNTFTTTVGYQTVPEIIKLGSAQECINNAKKFDGVLRKYTGYGNTVDEAIDALTEKCNEYRVPEPLLVPGMNDEWYCGTFTLPGVKKEIRYNKVWFDRKQKEIVAYAFNHP